MSTITTASHRQPGEPTLAQKLFLFTHTRLLGRIVTVYLTNGTVFEGVLHSFKQFGRDGISVALKMARCIKSCENPPRDPTRYHENLLIPAKDFAEMLAQGVPEQESVPRKGTSTSSSGGRVPGFQTDSQVSRSSDLVRERRLERWEPDEDADGSVGGIEDDSLTMAGHGGRGGMAPGPALSNGAWDQFQVNESKFGLTTDFDEEIYTTPLDRNSEDYLRKEKEASRIAREIESEVSDNKHVMEERGQRIEDDNDDEEVKYSSVLRGRNAKSGKGSPQNHGKPASSVAAWQAGGHSSAGPRSSIGRAGGDPSNTARYEAPKGQANPYRRALAQQPPHSTAPRTTSSPGAAGTPSEMVPPPARNQGSRRLDLPPSGPTFSGSGGSTVSTTSTPDNPKEKAAEHIRSLQMDVRNLPHMRKQMQLRFAEFAYTERSRIDRKRRECKSSSIQELMEFGKNFKLPTECPEDIDQLLGVNRRKTKKSTSEPVLAERSMPKDEPNCDQRGGTGNGMEASQSTCRDPGTSLKVPQPPVASASVGVGQKPPTPLQQATPKKQPKKEGMSLASDLKKETKGLNVDAPVFVPGSFARVKKPTSAFFGDKDLKLSHMDIMAELKKSRKGNRVVPHNQVAPTWPHGQANRLYRFPQGAGSQQQQPQVVVGGPEAVADPFYGFRAAYPQAHYFAYQQYQAMYPGGFPATVPVTATTTAGASGVRPGPPIVAHHPNQHHPHHHLHHPHQAQAFAQGYAPVIPLYPAPSPHPHHQPPHMANHVLHQPGAQIAPGYVPVPLQNVAVNPQYQAPVPQAPHHQQQAQQHTQQPEQQQQQQTQAQQQRHAFVGYYQQQGGAPVAGPPPIQATGGAVVNQWVTAAAVAAAAAHGHVHHPHQQQPPQGTVLAPGQPQPPHQQAFPVPSVPPGTVMAPNPKAYGGARGGPQVSHSQAPQPASLSPPSASHGQAPAPHHPPVALGVHGGPSMGGQQGSRHHPPQHRQRVMGVVTAVPASGPGSGPHAGAPAPPADTAASQSQS